MSAPAVDLGRATAEFIDAFNRADWDRMRANLAPDVHYTETGTGRQIDGVDPYIDLCADGRSAFPDVAGTVTNIPASGRRVAADASFWALTG